MAGKDLVVKMTIDSKQFDNNLENAKKNMKGFERDAKQSGDGFGNVMKGMGKAVAAFAVASKAFDVAKKAMNATEGSADKLASQMRQFEKVNEQVTKAIFFGIGSYNDFSQALDDIARNAENAYAALDALGTFKMFGGAEKSIINAEISEARAIINDKSASPEARAAAQATLNTATDRLRNLGDEELRKVKDAQVAVLREIANVGEGVTDAMLKEMVEAWKVGPEYLGQKAQDFYAKHAHQAYRTTTIGNAEGVPAYEMQQAYDVWDDEVNRATYNAMENLRLAKEDDTGWKAYFDLVTQEGQTRTEIANTVNRANRAAQKTLSTVKSGTGTSTAAKELTPAQLGQYYFNMKSIPGYQPVPIEDEDIFEPETDLLVEQNKKARKEEAEAWQTRINNLNDYSTAIGSLGNAFNQLSSVAADGSPWQKFTAIIGGVASQVAGLISVYTSLVAVESVAESISSGKGIPFPYNLVAMAAAASAIIGIVATVSSQVKSAGDFANGGIVGGNSYSGDHLIAHVNSGEMILNRQQQASLFGGGNVHFVIEGSQLQGCLDNYHKTLNL